MKKILLFLIYIQVLNFLSCSPNASQNSAGQLSSSCSHFGGIKFELKDGASCSAVYRFIDVHKSIQTISPIQLLVSMVTFYKDRRWQSVSEDNVIELVEKNILSETLDQENMVWYHELGHVVFNNLTKAHIQTPLKFTDSNISAYHELFADFIAMMFSENLDATWASFSASTKNSFGYAQFKALSFLKENQDGTCNGGGHLYFTFSRPSVADRFFKLGMTAEQKKEAVITFFKLIYTEALANERADKINLDCKTANANLIKKLSLLN